jgi:hypothetical protein
MTVKITHTNNKNCVSMAALWNGKSSLEKNILY